jgi:hypothetical protein
MASAAERPFPLNISTITAVGGLGTCVRLPQLFARIELDGPLGVERVVGSDGFVTAKFEGVVRRRPGQTDEGEGKYRRGGSSRPPMTFGNQVTLVLALEGARVNIKVFRNGRVQMTGLKQVDQGPRAMRRVEAAIRALLPPPPSADGGAAAADSGGDEDEVVADRAALGARDYKVCLINSDFDLGFRVKRDLLLRCINTHYPATQCSYEPCVYPGAKVKFMWNAGEGAGEGAGSLAAGLAAQGACRCTQPCFGRGDGDGDGRCRKVTVAVFQSGKVIITGAHTEAQLLDAHGFLVDEVVAAHAPEFTLAPSPVGAARKGARARARARAGAGAKGGAPEPEPASAPTAGPDWLAQKLAALQLQLKGQEQQAQTAASLLPPMPELV